MRLDHLLSREIRVSILGGIGALMAPTVDRTVDRFPSQVGSAGARKGNGDRPRPGEITEPVRPSVSTALCHSSRVKAQRALRTEPDPCPARSMIARPLAPAGV